VKVLQPLFAFRKLKWIVLTVLIFPNSIISIYINIASRHLMVLGGLLTIWNGSLFSGEPITVTGDIVTVKFTSNLSDQTFHVTNVYGTCTSASKASFSNWLYN
jgi:hypothetical protein